MSHMAFKLAIVFVLAVSFLFSNTAVKAEECEAVEFTSDKCRSASYITVLGQQVNKGETKRIKLPSSTEREVRWYCGSSEERTAWNTPANQLRVMYQSDGSIRWSIYKCANLTGPKKAGLNCAVPETTEYCPKFGGVNSSACVFELKKSTSNVNKKTTTVSIEGTLRGEVTKEAGQLSATGSAEVTAGVSQSYTQAKIVTYESRQFLVIPAGFSFCAFTNNTSVRDDHAATGFRWKCMFPQYIQAQEKFSSGRCTSLEICDVGVCGRTEVGSGGDYVQTGLVRVLIICLIAFVCVY